MMPEFQSHSPEDTQRHAEEWARACEPPRVILLSGDLGAGKTEWVRGLLRGVASTDEVTSPTFGLVHEYRDGRCPIFHWDLYRLDETTDWSVLDLDEHMQSGALTVIEWPERYPHSWPEHAVRVRLEIVSDQERKITCAS